MKRTEPEVGVALCVRDGNKVLMHKRKKPSVGPGNWAFPGGHIEMYESFEQTAIRELFEEAGHILVTKPKILTVANEPFPDEGRHCICVIMIADYIGGEPTVMEPEKCECWEWFDWNDLPRPLMPGCQQLKLEYPELPV